MKNSLLVFFMMLLASCQSSQPALPEGTVVDSLVIYKKSREMVAFRDGQLLKTYAIRLGDAPVGQKHAEGDERTPEGCYTINDRNPASGYHKNLGISYPNAAQKAAAKAAGKAPGGDIKIHGRPNGTWIPQWAFSLRDWTNGCIAVSNEEVDELFRAVKPGAPICIFP